jgi:4-oxalocrotonate tautomerase
MPNITIQWFAGRTDQQKREITAAITDAMVKIGKTTADQVHIVFQDVEKTNWASTESSPAIRGRALPLAAPRGADRRPRRPRAGAFPSGLRTYPAIA